MLVSAGGYLALGSPPPTIARHGSRGIATRVSGDARLRIFASRRSHSEVRSPAFATSVVIFWRSAEMLVESWNRRIVLSSALLLTAGGCRAERDTDPTETSETGDPASDGSSTPGSDESSSGEATSTGTTGGNDSTGAGTTTTSATTTGTGDAETGALADTGATQGETATALDGLRTWLATPREARPPLRDQAFAAIPLDRESAATAEALLWEDLAEHIRTTRRAEVDAKAITLDGFTLRYETVALGGTPPGGRSLFISMHGGGSAPPETNDEQWRNQVALAEGYMPEDTLWIAPRAPTDDWNMWFKDHIDPLFDRLITNMIVFEGIDPNRVYLNGYSAGGDGVYQLGPRMADRFAAVGMSAGHPNDASPLNLRNLPFALHVGGDDTAFERNEVALEWGEMLDALQAQDPEGYAHQVEVHPGLPHWMNLADRVSIPFMQGYTRSVRPHRVVWRQPTTTQARFYWLRVRPEEPGTHVEARIEGQAIHVAATGVQELDVRLSDEMLDLDAPVTVVVDGVALEETLVPRTIRVLHDTLLEREDPAAMFAGELTVTLP